MISNLLLCLNCKLFLLILLVLRTFCGEFLNVLHIFYQILGANWRFFYTTVKFFILQDKFTFL